MSSASHKPVFSWEVSCLSPEVTWLLLLDLWSQTFYEVAVIYVEYCVIIGGSGLFLMLRGVFKGVLLQPRLVEQPDIHVCCRSGHLSDGPSMSEAHFALQPVAMLFYFFDLLVWICLLNTSSLSLIYFIII